MEAFRELSPVVQSLIAGGFTWGLTALEDLDARLRTVLPEAYQDSYETVQPVSMGSAGLKFDGDGRVTDRIVIAASDPAFTASVIEATQH